MTGLISLLKTQGDEIEFITQSKSWMIRLFRSPNLWVVGLIFLPRFCGRQSGFAAVKRWLDNELHLLGSVALCRVSSECLGVMDTEIEYLKNHLKS